MKLLPIVLLCFLPNLSNAQDTINHSKKVKRWLLWYTPSKADVINGITLSPIESFYFYADRSQQFNGIVLHAVGIMLFPLLPGDPSDLFVDDHPDLAIDTLLAKRKEETDTTNPRQVVNGVILSVTGTITTTCNGINISPWCGLNGVVNGFVFNLVLNINSNIKGLAVAVATNMSFDVKGSQIAVRNSAYNIEGLQLGLINKNKRRSRVRGVQIGLFNQTDYLEGIQVGLFNKNRYRSLPLINWHFSSKKNKDR